MPPFDPVLISRFGNRVANSRPHGYRPGVSSTRWPPRPVPLRERNRPNGTWGRPLTTREGADDCSNRKSWLIPLTFYVVERLGGPIRFPKAAECSVLLFNVLMVVVAIIAIALTVPRDDPGVGR